MDMLARIRQEMLPFAELLGIEFVSAAPDKIVAEMTVRQDLCTRPAVSMPTRDRFTPITAWGRDLGQMQQRKVP